MAYEKQNFEDGQVLTAEHLNNMEQGIEEAAVQTDWNQTDDTAPDYLKNKPFGDELVEIIPEMEVVGELNEDVGGVFATEFDPTLHMIAPDSLAVCFDGVQYICHKFEEDGTAFYGNLGIFGAADTGEPFLMMYIPYAILICLLLDGEPHSVGISDVSARTIDPTYLPNSTEFFWGFSDEYLYKDVELTTKATREDVLSAVGKGFVIKTLMNGEEVMTIHPSTVIYQRSIRTYAVVEVVFNGKISTLYTVEYTPPST